MIGAPSYTSNNKDWTVTISNSTHHWNFSLELEIIQDTDYDLTPNTEDSDDDNDGVPDTLDSCPIQLGNSTIDRRGCPDTDGDGTSNLGDPFLVTALNHQTKMGTDTVIIPVETVQTHVYDVWRIKTKQHIWMP